ncbi:site-specific recombinase XerD [Bradyrhizobium japonicum]
MQTDEVVKLTLDNIDLRASKILVRAKGAQRKRQRDPIWRSG